MYIEKYSSRALNPKCFTESARFELKFRTAVLVRPFTLLWRCNDGGHGVVVLAVCWVT